MKKVYEIRKYIVAEDIAEALELEKGAHVEEIYITKHSSDILLDELHTKIVVEEKNDRKD